MSLWKKKHPIAKPCTRANISGPGLGSNQMKFIGSPDDSFFGNCIIDFAVALVLNQDTNMIGSRLNHVL